MDAQQLKTEAVELLQWLGKFGEDPEGGISRLLYSKEWVEAQHALKEKFADYGLKPEFDDVGNLFGRLEGSKYPNETILSGSHVDTVTNGGYYDGQYGIIAAFLAVKYLKEKHGQPLRNIDIVSIAEEEGSRFPFAFWGSKNMVGAVNEDEVKDVKDFDGVPFTEAMEKAGFRLKTTSAGIPEDWKAWVELHIEQGGVLEIEKKPIGIVQHIVGQRRYTIEIDGQANHAGTTPMKYRKDAAYAASKMIFDINKMGHEYGEPLVATVGKIELTPNTVNVVPGKAIFTIDVRHTEKEDILNFTEKMEEMLKETASDFGVGIDIDLWMDEDPVPMDQGIVQKIKEQCDENDVNYKLMHSGAGHDTQRFAPYIPSAMVFVPSREGISHNPAEYTEPKDLAEGIQVLMHTLYELAYV